MEHYDITHLLINVFSKYVSCIMIFTNYIVTRTVFFKAQVNNVQLLLFVGV